MCTPTLPLYCLSFNQKEKDTLMSVGQGWMGGRDGAVPKGGPGWDAETETELMVHDLSYSTP